jgi:glycosyltransferase involved in cell wall biosynthesis
MEIAVVGPTFPFRGGISNYNTLLCENLSQSHTVHLFSFRRQYPRWLFPGNTDCDSSARSLHTIGVPTLDPMNPLSWLRTARRVMSVRPDLLILHWWVTFWALPFATIAGLVRRTGVPVLYLCHNVLPHEEKPWDRVLARLALSQGDHHITMAEAEKMRLEALLPGARAIQVPLPDSLALKDLSPIVSQSEARRELGLESAELVALFFGFVRSYKGLRYLLEAVPEVLRHVDVHVVIAGEFWEDKASYLEMISRLGIEGAVTVVDRYVPNEEIGTFFSAADVVVLPYVHVTQSAVVQLAFAFDKPVITTSVGELPRVVEHGKTGLIVPPQDSSSLAAALVSFVRDLKQHNWAVSIAEARKGFSWSRMVQIIEGIVLSRGVAKGGAGDG